MVLHTCKYCGAPGVDYSEAQDGIVRCHYCGNLNDVPGKQPPAELVLALSNADNELFNCRFEAARESYSKVITMSPKDPQGYFGRALAKFKIKYLKDERYSTESEARYQPICYGVTDKLFSQDVDYLKALELATPAQKEQYSKQAKDIDKIISNFQALKAKNIDYDVFICCKVTDDVTGQKTRDAYDAQRIYVNLQNKGFKPFFSEMDMGDFTGSEYEAVILYALYMSESMLIVCSNEDYLNTPWVKNEYSRFLSMTANGYKSQGSLTFVYKGKPIEQLPDGKRIQGIDRDSFGSSDRIADFVRKFQPQAQAATKFCASCGNECRASAKMCDECGGREFFATHDEYVEARARAQARKEQAEREEQLKKEQAERERKHDEEMTALRRQLEEAQGRKAQEAEQAARVQEEAERAKEKEQQCAQAETEQEQYLEFELSDDGTSYTVIGFDDDLPVNVYIPAQHKNLPVIGIGRRLFFQCDGLKSITIPNSVTSIGESAFEGCSSLTSIIIPNSVTSIGSSAFSGCSSLESIIIPNSVTSIDKFTFSHCSGLIKITIPNSITSIQQGSFYACSGLKSITLPDSVTSIGSDVFMGCTNLEKLEVEQGNEVYYSKNNCIIEKAKRILVVGCKASIIPDDGSVTSIKNSAFAYCSSLTSITLPNSVVNIGAMAFCGCSGLTSIAIPNSIKYLSGAFRDCSGLTSIAIPDSVISINEQAFEGCSSLISIKIPNSVKTIGVHAFGNCSSLKSITFPNSVKIIESGAFANCSGLTSITIPDSVESIGDYAFEGCKKLKSVTMPRRLAGFMKKNIKVIFGDDFDRISFTFTK